MLCKYCGEQLDPPHENRGFCGDCYDIIIKDPLSFKKEILDNIDLPFFVVSQSSQRVVTANEEFLNFISKSFDQIANQLGGDVIGCIHAANPHGCGKGEFCSKCPIRNLVQKTIDTQNPQKHVHVVQLIKHEGETKDISLHVTTRIKNGYVLLQIDDYEFLS